MAGRVTITVQDTDTDKVFSVVANADTIANARTLGEAKIALMTNIEVQQVLESTQALADAYVPDDGPGDGDAVLTLRIGSDRATTRTVNMRNVTTAVKDAIAQDGSIDVSNALVTAFGAAYKDADGGGGYTVIRGQFLD